jgi:hypothetical protein
MSGARIFKYCPKKTAILETGPFPDLNGPGETGFVNIRYAGFVFF